MPLTVWAHYHQHPRPRQNYITRLGDGNNFNVTC